MTRSMTEGGELRMIGQGSTKILSVRGLAVLIAIVITVGSSSNMRPANASSDSTRETGASQQSPPSWSLELAQLAVSLGGTRLAREITAHIDQQAPTTIDELWAGPVHDVTGDHLRDVIVIETTISFDLGDGLSEPGIHQQLLVSVRSGRTGKELWQERESVDGLIWLEEGRFGPKAQNGFVLQVAEHRGNYDGALELIALRGRDGKRLWHTVMEPTYDDHIDSVEDWPFSTGLLDALPGKATDVLVGRTTTIPRGGAGLFDTGVSIIDGKDGRRVDHPAREIAMNWWPVPISVGLQDGDPYDDYSLVNNFGVVPVLDPDGGDLVELGGLVRARNGVDGREIWAIGGLDVGDANGAAAWGMTDLFGDRSHEVRLSVVDAAAMGGQPVPLPITQPVALRGSRTYVIEGGGSQGSASLRFESDGLIRYGLGDIDSDREEDLLNEKSPIAQGLSSSGEVVWEKTYAPPGCEDAICDSGFPDFVAIGDMRLDESNEVVAYLPGGQDASGKQIFLIDGNDGRVRYRGNGLDFPLGSTCAPGDSCADGSLDGHGTDILRVNNRGREGLELLARDGRDRSVLVRVTVSSDLDLPNGSLPQVVSGPLNEDRCDEILLLVGLPKLAYLLALDGGSGQMLWAEAISGPDQHVGVHVSADRNRTC